jgi:hypothetical protein
MINGMRNPTGVYRFIDCITEATSVGFTSDAFTPQINDLHIIGGRWVLDMAMFNFHPSAKITAMKLNGIDITSLTGTNTVILVNSHWLTISGCSIFGNSAFHGGDEADMTITGNRFEGSVLLNGAFRALMFTGNVHQGLTNTTSGSRLVTNNLQWGI